MKSYEKDLQESITSSQTVHKSIFQHSLDKQGTPQNDSAKFDLGLDPLVSLPAEGKAEYLTVFNSLTRQKDESISFLVETSKYQTICISDKNNYLLKHQVSPYFNRSVFIFFFRACDRHAQTLKNPNIQIFKHLQSWVNIDFYLEFSLVKKVFGLSLF
jgi:hypothetical protein